MLQPGLVILVLWMLAVSVMANAGDRRRLMKLILGLHRGQSGNSGWSLVDGDAAPEQEDSWLNADPTSSASDWPVSVPDLKPDQSYPTNVEKKWSNRAKFHFSGFICCNQAPPTGLPKPKRLRSNGDDKLRSLLLGDISRYLADDSSQGISGTVGVNYEPMRNQLLDFPMLEDPGVSEDSFLAPDLNGRPSVQRRGGITVRSQRPILHAYTAGLTSPTTMFKRSFKPSLEGYKTKPVSPTAFDSPPGHITFNRWLAYDVMSSPKLSDNGPGGTTIKRNNSDPQFSDYFHGLGSTNGR